MSVREFKSISLKARDIVGTRPSFADLIQALVITCIEDVREINSDLMSDGDYVATGLPALEDLEEMAIEHLMTSIPEMYDYADFKTMITDAVKCAVAADPKLFELTYQPRRAKA